MVFVVDNGGIGLNHKCVSNIIYCRALKWTGGTNDRLRTANTSLTRYDTQLITTIADTTLAGYLYINASAAIGRYFTITLNEDDEVTLYMKAQNGTGVQNFVYQGALGAK